MACGGLGSARPDRGIGPRGYYRTPVHPQPPMAAFQPDGLADLPVTDELARAPRDMRSLSAFLAALDRYSLEHMRPLTLPLLRELLQARQLAPQEN